MKTLKSTVLALFVVMLGSQGAKGASVTIEPLSREWAQLAMITGFHAVIHRPSGLALRVLEADGSTSAAENPVSLFVVATNQGTSDPREYVWRLPIGVSRVKKVTASKCGLDIAALQDLVDKDQRVVGSRVAIIKACFIDPKGELEPRLHISRITVPLRAGI